MSTADVTVALRNTSKGRVRYDRNWQPTVLALEEISSSPSLSRRWVELLDDSRLEVTIDSSRDVRTKTDEVKDILSKESVKAESLHDDKLVNKKKTEKSENERENERESPVKTSRKVTVIPSPFSDNYVDVDIDIYTYEKELEDKKVQAIKARKEKFRVASLQLQHEAKQNLQQIQIEKLCEHDKDVRILKEFEEKHSEKLRRNYQVLQQIHQEQARRQSELHYQLMNKERERQQTAAIAFKKVENLLEEITSIGVAVQEVIRNCKHPKFLQRELVAKIFSEFQNVYRVASENVKKAKSDHFQAPSFIKRMEEYIHALKSMLNTAQSICKDAENKGAKEEAEIKAKLESDRKAKEAEIAAKEAAKVKAIAEKEAKAAADAAKSVTPAAVVSATTAAPQSSVTSIEKYGRYEDYFTYQNFLNEISKKCETLLTSKDKEQKKFVFNLKMAVISPINAIADTNAAHLKDKIKSLSSLLSGQTVKVTGKLISITAYPEAQLLSQELVAKSFVMQGVSQVSSSSDSAYCIAAVALGVWQADPQVGQLMLAHFYKMCPYLVPYYIPRMEGQSLEEYRSLQGYNVKDGKIEEDDKFLQRITGIVRLFAAIMSSLPPQGVQAHPFNIENGWTLLARILNLEPHLDTTATVLFNFLEVAGHAMMARFKKQFQKMLFVLCKEYVPKIEKITPKNKFGPVSRLKIFLEKCVSTGTIPVPGKYLTQQWWRS